MNIVRTAFSSFVGLMKTNGSSWRADEPDFPPAAPNAGSERLVSPVKPRHVLCFLGPEPDLAKLSEAASAAIDDIAPGYSIDQTYSRSVPDENMRRSFQVCRDRVQQDAWSKSDEEAVEKHGSVLYVLGPRMIPDNAVMVSSAALRLIDTLIKAGAVAVKGESAGVAHGLARWRELIAQAGTALKSDDDLALSRACRLAFAKRPLASDTYLETVGFHLVGQPEVYVPKSYGSELQTVAVMDAVADDILRRGLETTLKDRGAMLSFASPYETDDFKFNPYGVGILPS